MRSSAVRSNLASHQHPLAQCAAPWHAGLPPSDSSNSLAVTVTPNASAHSLQAMAAAGAEALPPSPRSPRSPRMRHVGSSSLSSGGSREGSRHGGAAAGVVLGIPLLTAEGAAEGVAEEGGAEAGPSHATAKEPAPQATVEERAADAGMQATAGALAMAGVVVAADVLGELEEPATPAGRQQGDSLAAATPPAPFEGLGEAWRDLTLLSGISGAAGMGMDFCAY